MAETKSGIVLSEGETLVTELEAELWATSSNIFARIIGAIQKFFAMIFGYRRRGFVVITNKRVVEVSNIISCYCFTVGREVKYVLPSSIKEVGYTREATCGCFCPAYYFYYESHTQTTKILLKGVDQSGAQKIVDAFYLAIANAQTGAND